MKLERKYLAKGGIDERTPSQKRADAQGKAKTLADIAKKTNFGKPTVLAVDNPTIGSYGDENGQDTARVINASEQLLQPVTAQQVRDGEVAHMIDMPVTVLASQNTSDVPHDKMAKVVEIVNKAEAEMVAARKMRQQGGMGL